MFYLILIRYNKSNQDFILTCYDIQVQSSGQINLNFDIDLPLQAISPIMTPPVQKMALLKIQNLKPLLTRTRHQVSMPSLNLVYLNPILR